MQVRAGQTSVERCLQAKLRFRLYLVLRKGDRDDFLFVLPYHVLHVDRDAAETGVAARLLGARAKDRLDLLERHPRFDFRIVFVRDPTAAAANEKKQTQKQYKTLELMHVGVS